MYGFFEVVAEITWKPVLLSERWLIILEIPRRSADGFAAGSTAGELDLTKGDVEAGVGGRDLSLEDRLTGEGVVEAMGS